MLRLLSSKTHKRKRTYHLSVLLRESHANNCCFTVSGTVLILFDTDVNMLNFLAIDTIVSLSGEGLIENTTVLNKDLVTAFKTQNIWSPVFV